MNKILAIVGVGEAAIPIIKKAKELNITTIGFGQKGSLAEELVNVFIEKSIFDIDGLEKECIENGVNGVIASSEITTEAAAILAKRLNLPGNSVDKGFFAKNKYLMRQAVAAIDTIRQPDFYLYDGRNIEKFPVMVKAVDSCGKNGIRLVKNKEELNKAIQLSKTISSDGTVLIEEYLRYGQEYSIECLSNDKDSFIIQITEKVTSGEPYFTEISHHQPAIIDSDIRTKIERGVKDTLQILGINCGMSHMEVKVINKEIYFIEVGARAGGDHIADTLTVLSTDYDYYKGAIECSFGELNRPKVNNVSFTGIYFHCKQNEIYHELFEKAKTAEWCVDYTIKSNQYNQALMNLDTAEAGYFIYKSDHKIDLGDTNINSLKAERINDYKNAYDIIWNHNKEIGRTLTDEELKKGIHKFITNGNVIAILEGERIIAVLILYCNNYETLEAYICNVYVLKQYRGIGMSELLMKEAISISKKKKFRKIKLHVDADNFTAINLYKKHGFIFNGEQKEVDEKEIELEMEMTLYGEENL